LKEAIDNSTERSIGVMGEARFVTFEAWFAGDFHFWDRQTDF
jgi:hypothetical protein